MGRAAAAAAGTRTGNATKYAGEPVYDKVRGLAIAFGRELQGNPLLLRQCADKETFKRAVNDFKDAEYDAGRVHKGSPSDVLKKMERMSGKDRQFYVLPKVFVKQNVITFMQIGSKETKAFLLGATKQRVEEERETIEANKHGIVVSPVKFKDAVSVNSHFSVSVTITNISSTPCRLESATMCKACTVSTEMYTRGCHHGFPRLLA
jgi:hypothetical protein